MRRRQWLAGAGVVVLAGGAGVYLGARQRPEAEAPAGSDPAGSEAGQSRAGLDSAFPLLGGGSASLNHWQAPLRLVNFWATWCPPCLEEIPVLVDLQTRFGPRGLQILGVAIDQRAAVAGFAERHDINYPVLVAEGQGIALARALGNEVGALPYTAALAADGSALYRHQGELTAEQAEALAERLLAALD